MIETLYIFSVFGCFGVIASFIAKRIEKYERKEKRFERHRQAAKDMAAMNDCYIRLIRGSDND